MQLFHKLSIFGAVLAMGVAVQPAYSQVKLPFGLSQRKDKDSIPKADTARKPSPPPVSKYDQVVNKNYSTQQGLFSVHQYKDSIYFEIPDSLLGRDLVVINRMAQAPAGLPSYAGEEISEKTIIFEKRDSSILIRYDLVANYADSSNAIYKAVAASNANPIAYVLPIKAYNHDSSGYVIDASKILTEKNFINDVDGKTALGKAINTNLIKDFHVNYLHVYPKNVEVEIAKNSVAIGKLGDMAQEPVTMVTHSSFVELPKVPMQQRIFDPRVGFFADYLYAFADDQQKVEERQFILRWRLEPRDEDRAKWERGELVEPRQPIVIYIDPATPKQWRPYLVQGINDWQKAFEQAGFKNAIQGKEWPENDTTMHMDDARYSWLNYFPSPVKNARGPNVHDPRSGEIIQTHIEWYHNVMGLLHDWYQVQTAAVDPQARKAKLSDSLMGQLVRFVSSHEVGHTLGLRHNFGSSSRTPVDSLRNLAYLRAHGHTASIMDYARFNYVAQPEDHIPQELLFPHIGEYDRWAIEWGYKNANAKNVEEDKAITRAWITDRTAKNPRLWFGDGETQHFDPRSQTEDLGDNAAKASMYGIRNLQRILPHLVEWNEEPGGVHTAASEMYQEVKGQYTRYLSHVIKYIGGFQEDKKADGQTGDVVTPVPKALQQQAVQFFIAEVLNTPRWLLDPAVLNKTNAFVAAAAEDGTVPKENFVEDMQAKTMNSLLDIARINRLLNMEERFGNKAYSPVEYLATLHKAVWNDLKTGTPVTDRYRRNLQKTYVGAVLTVLVSKTADNAETDASSLLRADILQLKNELAAAIPRTQDALTKAHLADLEYRIKSATAAKED